MLPRTGIWIAHLCPATAVALLVGCSPMSPEAMIRAEELAYERAHRQIERHAEFIRDRRQCNRLGGIMVIERRGGLAKRRPPKRDLPDVRDIWHCRM